MTTKIATTIVLMSGADRNQNGILSRKEAQSAIENSAGGTIPTGRLGRAVKVNQVPDSGDFKLVARLKQSEIDTLETSRMTAHSTFIESVTVTPD